ncbi:MAG: D-tyrosyl-tRNA(Tyr) deacylase [Acholeplasmataceae bacterium]|nr:D-tyrosyl-tRNA(Tyr) deacylase [Acholeplasmataceae bacterium]
MRALIQRVSRASVSVDDSIVAQIDRGLLILVGFTEGDTEEKIRWIVNKIAKLRIFPDQDDKMNLSVVDVDGELLAVSQFTLYGDLNDGNRPSFTKAMAPALAEPMFKKFLDLLAIVTSKKIESGVFGAHMEVNLVNDGPVTIMLER